MTTPTVSDKYIMAKYPLARTNERAALIDMVSLKKCFTVLDLQSAGG